MPQAALIDDGITFDRVGRMKYNPDFHPNSGKPFTQSDLEYLCKYYYIDGVKSMAYAMGRTERVIAGKVYKLKVEGLFNYYKNLNVHW